MQYLQQHTLQYSQLVTILAIYFNTSYRRYLRTDSTISYGCQMNNYSSHFTIIHWTPATIPWYSSISAPPSFHRPCTPSSYSVIAIKAKCVCQALFQRVTHRMGSQQFSTAGGMRPSHKRMPTKLCVMVEAKTDHLGVPATKLNLTCWPPTLSGCFRQSQVSHGCWENYLLQTVHFCLYHAWLIQPKSIL